MEVSYVREHNSLRERISNLESGHCAVFAVYSCAEEWHGTVVDERSEESDKDEDD